MKPIEEYNELLLILVKQLKESIELSHQAANKLQEIFKDYKVIKKHE
jgi:hypothetical protein